MADVTIEQTIHRRDRNQEPRLVARSPGLAEELFSALDEILVAFGERPPGIACPGAVFAQPLGEKHVAVIRVNDGDPGPDGWAELRYHSLILTRDDYAGLGGDPFAVARMLDASEPLRAILLPPKAISTRGIEDVRAVLKRIKANSLPDNFDPKSPPPLTVENAESPMLLGGVQILVDGGRLVFERPRPDASVVEALWTLLPHNLRPQLWPATFAFNNDLAFDVIVVPRLDSIPLQGYTTEAQAGDYPAGSYELALQIAAEAGDPSGLEAAFQRRTGRETLGLAIKLLVGVSLLVIAMRFLTPGPRTDVVARAATVAGIVGARDPWTALPMIDLGKRLYK